MALEILDGTIDATAPMRASGGCAILGVRLTMLRVARLRG